MKSMSALRRQSCIDSPGSLVIADSLPGEGVHCGCEHYNVSVSKIQFSLVGDLHDVCGDVLPLLCVRGHVRT